MPNYHENKYDKGKVRMNLVEPKFITSIARVMTYAIEEKGYKENSWKEVPDPINRYYAALMRHLMSFRDEDEDDYDEESGFLHIAHAACCIMIILWFELKNKVLRKEVTNGKDSII